MDNDQLKQLLNDAVQTLNKSLSLHNNAALLKIAMEHGAQIKRLEVALGLEPNGMDLKVLP